MGEHDEDSARVFVSYRRGSADALIGRFVDRLNTAFGADNVFRDTSDIKGADDWLASIEAELARADVLLVAIGPNWLQHRGSDQDWVRHELNTGRANGCSVLPIRLDDTPMPEPTELGDLDWLLGKHAMRLRTDDADFNDDVDRIVTRINEIHGPATGQRVPWWTTRRRLVAIAGACALVLLAVVGFIILPDDDGSPNLLRNSDFTVDDAWAANYLPDDVAFDIDVDGGGHQSDGVGIVSVSAPDGSIAQDLERDVHRGETVEFSVWIRSRDGQPIDGRLGAWVGDFVSGDQEPPCCTTDVLQPFVATAEWRSFTFVRTLNSDHDEIVRAEIYVRTLGATLLIDDAELHIS